MNYDAEAKRIANFVCRQDCERHRGVLPLKEPGASALFGNDDYWQDEQTRNEVRLLILEAFESNIRVLGFAVDDENGSAWALVVACDDLDWLKARLHDSYFEAHRLYTSDGVLDDVRR